MSWSSPEVATCCVSRASDKRLLSVARFDIIVWVTSCEEGYDNEEDEDEDEDDEEEEDEDEDDEEEDEDDEEEDEDENDEDEDEDDEYEEEDEKFEEGGMIGKVRSVVILKRLLGITFGSKQSVIFSVFLLSI